MDYNLLVLLKEQLLQLVGLLCSVVLLYMLYLSIKGKKELNEVKSHLINLIELKLNEDKNIPIQLEEEKIQAIEELDTPKITSLTLSLDQEKLDLLKNLLLEIQEKEKEVDTK
jgi:hypothetical protein